MGKRKRENQTNLKAANGDINQSAKTAKSDHHVDVKTTKPVIQIIVGSYERVLHGITASLSEASSKSKTPSVQFSDTFLFNAHASAIRCLALSPLPSTDSSDNQGVFLATGGSDEKINLFSLSASPFTENGSMPAMPSLGKNVISENPKNRELGTLLHHSSNITALYFPTRSKLLSASEDNTVAVTRVKDLTVVSTVKAPRPKVQGQPSGDTAPPGSTPAGVNDFAVHPSLKLMVSVGRAERCMRLWNLVTGKKAGVLNFNRDILQSIKEGKYSSGEGKRIKWNPDGTEFAVAFERGVIVYGDDSTPRCKILPSPLTKLHQIAYLAVPNKKDELVPVLAVSTEDGRVLFYNTDKPKQSKNGTASGENAVSDAPLLGQLGGKAAGINNRVKDFDILSLSSGLSPKSSKGDILVITGSSDGSVKLFFFAPGDLFNTSKDGTTNQVGTLVGTYETGNRITCLKSFEMLPPASDEVDDLKELANLSDGEHGNDSESDGQSD